MVMVVTVVLSFLAGLAFRTPFRGSRVVFYLAVDAMLGLTAYLFYAMFRPEKF